jgi:uncharacterized YigZ family protein
VTSFTLSAPVLSETEIRKSRFIGMVLPVDSRDAAMTQLESLREAHHGAAHVCWALLAGGQSGMSDDGEPSGTAGRPILEVLRHHQLDGVLGVVVRYYGGIKLGAGGLVRAYSDAVAGALKEAQLVQRVSLGSLIVEVDYADEPRVRHWLETRQHVLAGSTHGATALLEIRVPEASLAKAREELNELTRGRCRCSG